MNFGISFILGFGLAILSTLPAPATILRDRGSVIVSDKGGTQRWTAEWTMEPWRETGLSAVRFTEMGHGHYSPYVQPVSWSLEAVWTADGSFRPFRFDKTITDAGGHTIARERKNFDVAKGTVRFERTRSGLPPETKEISIPPDTLTVEGIAGVLQFLPFEAWRPFTAHFLTNEPQLYEMRFEMRGKERVKTSAGEFECYKIELVPQLGLLNALRPFLHRVYFWFSVAAPHFCVRYEGPENGQGTPQIVMELKK
jgi:hypothetical protein